MPNSTYRKPAHGLLQGPANSYTAPEFQKLKPGSCAPSQQSRPLFGAATATAKAAKEVSSASPPPTAAVPEKPATDVVAGAMARAASQGTIHPLDTMKVRMQTGSYASSSGKGTPSAAKSAAPGMRIPASRRERRSLQRAATELKGLYRGVGGAATGAGIIIGAYFAFYSTTKRFLREKTKMHEGAIAFVAGAAAAVGSSVVKVPLAVCIRSVQAGVYPNVIQASTSIVKAAGARGLFTGFLPTVLEDVPDMAVKFTVYETLRPLHRRVFGGRQPTIVEDLLIGGTAGAAAAAATTPLDVVKTVMMCGASSRPTVMSSFRGVMAQGQGVAPFFRGVGPRALSNGLNSAIFFCFFEAIRQVLVQRQMQQSEPTLAASGTVAS